MPARARKSNHWDFLRRRARASIMDSVHITDKSSALILDESPESSEITAWLTEMGFHTLPVRDASEFHTFSAGELSRVRFIVLSLTFPGHDLPGARFEVLKQFPFTPVIPLGASIPPFDPDITAAGICMLPALPRPISRIVFENAIHLSLKYLASLGKYAKRQCFLSFPDWLEEPLARILHDLNNQLTGIKGGIDLFQYTLSSCSDQELHNRFNRYQNQFISPSLARLDQMILEWRKIRDPKYLSSKSPLPLFYAVSDMLDLAASPLEKKHISFRMAGAQSDSPDIPAAIEKCEVQIPREYFQLAFAQIARNALDAIEPTPSGRILLEFDLSEESNCHIRVFDNGPGFSLEAKENAWKTFFSTKGDGHLGMGLPIAKQIIERFQGQLDLLDSPLGGAGIGVRLPLA